MIGHRNEIYKVLLYNQGNTNNDLWDKGVFRVFKAWRLFLFLNKNIKTLKFEISYKTYC